MSRAVLLMLAAFAFGSAAFGQETPDDLSQALDRVHQVETPAKPLTDAQRIDLLTQAISLAQQAPNHRLKGHRVLAIQALRSAIAEIHGGDANHKAADFIHTADAELATSVSLAGGGDAAPSTNAAPQPDASWMARPSDNVTVRAAEVFNAARGGDLAKLKSLLAADPTLAQTHVDFGMTPLLGAAIIGNKDEVELLLANKADVNAQSELGQSALHDAAVGGFTEVANVLVAHGANVNARDTNGHTPLYEAMFAVPWRKDIATLLLAHGADPNLGDNDGATSLHEAATWIRPDKAEFLLNNKADVNARDKKGDTPLYDALSAGARDDIAQVLLAHGADPSIKGLDGLTPRDLALKNKDADMARILADLAGTLGPPPAPLDGVTPGQLIMRFASDVAKTPPGPVESDVTRETVDAFEGLAKMAGNTTPALQALAENYNKFTLHGSPTEIYAQGHAAIYAGRATLSPAAQDDFKANPPGEANLVVITQNDKPVSVQQGPFVSFGPGMADYADSQVPPDGEVTVSFCLVQQNGHWKVHCLYFSQGPLAGDNKAFVIRELATFSRGQGK